MILLLLLALLALLFLLLLRQERETGALRPFSKGSSFKTELPRAPKKQSGNVSETATKCFKAQELLLQVFLLHYNWYYSASTADTTTTATTTTAGTTTATPTTTTTTTTTCPSGGRLLDGARAGALPSVRT